MTSLRHNPNALRFAVAGAMAALVLNGCAAGAKLSRAEASPKELRKAEKNSEKGVVAAERQVERNPQSASLRTELGIAYLGAGRFASATTALDDAMRLGDNSARTALSLALAKIGAGKGREAVAILDDWRDSIPASDLGLALALAGESGRGVAILADTLRGGENTAKLRQNLAYAYALDGRWREARTMMAQDVPADLVDARMSEWALRAKPDDYQARVAGLLGAPMRADPGLPEYLAMANSATVEQLAAEATAVQPQSAPQPVSANSELPAANEAPAAPAVAAQNDPLPAPFYPEPAAPAAEQAATPVVQGNFANAFSAPVVAPQHVRPAPRKLKPTRTVRIVLPASKPVVARTGTHLVQLASYSSPQGARRGWGVLTARNPKLREYRMVITPAVVRGKNYWRVAAAGFNSGTAAGMCSSVKGRGGACFAYAATRAPAGAIPATQQGIAGPRMARRR